MSEPCKHHYVGDDCPYCEIERLRAALERIANSESPWHTPGSPTDAVVEIARETLELKP